MTVVSQPYRDLILALFKRIGEQPDLKEAWKTMPNAERNTMAGDFYNIIDLHTSTTSAEKVLEGFKEKLSLLTFYDGHPDGAVITWKNIEITYRELRQREKRA